MLHTQKRTVVVSNGDDDNYRFVPGSRTQNIVNALTLVLGFVPSAEVEDRDNNAAVRNRRANNEYDDSILIILLVMSSSSVFFLFTHTRGGRDSGGGGGGWVNGFPVVPLICTADMAFLSHSEMLHYVTAEQDVRI